MNRYLSYAIFITLASVVGYFLHWFVYKCLARSFGKDDRSRRFLKIAWYVIMVSGISIPLSMMASRLLDFHLLSYYTYPWLGVITIAWFILLLHWLITLIIKKSPQGLAVGALAVIGIITLVSFYNGLQAPELKHFEIKLKNLPARLSGFKVVQLSDLHLEPYRSDSSLKDIVDKTNSVNPDLIVITGDLVDGNICKDEKLCAQLKRLNAKHGIFAITGNHEFYTGIDDFKSIMDQSGIRLLRNQSATVAGEIQILGLDDDGANRFGGDGPNLDKAAANTDPSKPMILLYHRPALFDEALEKGVGLQLSGHTHAGQIPPMDLMVLLYYKYPYGLYEKDGSYIYTTSGTGLWGPPMRFLSRNEIPVFTLKSN